MYVLRAPRAVISLLEFHLLSHRAAAAKAPVLFTYAFAFSHEAKSNFFPAFNITGAIFAYAHLQCKLFVRVNLRHCHTPIRIDYVFSQYWKQSLYFLRAAPLLCHSTPPKQSFCLHRLNCIQMPLHTCC